LDGATIATKVAYPAEWLDFLGPEKAGFAYYVGPEANARKSRRDGGMKVYTDLGPVLPHPYFRAFELGLAVSVAFISGWFVKSYVDQHLGRRIKYGRIK
jgi:hypothetical protein